MDMQKVLKFMQTIQKQDGKVCVHCSNRFVEIPGNVDIYGENDTGKLFNLFVDYLIVEIPGDVDIYGENDTGKLFNLFVDYLNGLDDINPTAEQFNLYATNDYPAMIVV